MLRRSFALLRPSNPCRLLPQYQTIRYGSLNSAIEHGLRKSRSVEDSVAHRSYNERHHGSGQSGHNRFSAKRDSRQSRLDDPTRYRSGGEEHQASGQKGYGISETSRESRKPRLDDPAQRRSGNEEYRTSERRGYRASATRRDPHKFRATDDTASRYPTDRSQQVNMRRDYRPSIAGGEPTITTFDEDEFIRTGRMRPAAREMSYSHSAEASVSSQNSESRHRSRRTERPHRTDKGLERVKTHVKIPSSVPYTSPASEFIYGASAVEAALRCSRRKLHVLYIYQGQGEDLSAAKSTVRKLALSKGVKVKLAFTEWADILDKMSQNRPHNGLVLEASPLPQLPVAGLRAVSSIDDTHFCVDLDLQTREEAAVNGLDNRIPVLSLGQRRYPAVLLLEGIVDPGNLGGIVRSAYFLGIDALVFAGRNCAPLSPVAIKSSAGAAENMVILRTNNEVAFIKRSKANGWRFYAADAPSLDLSPTLIDPLTAANGNSKSGAGQLMQAPSVLMIGSEASGLSAHIKSHADSIVTIPGARLEQGVGVSSDPARVDSLNVSVAAALLMDMLIRVPLAISEVPSKRDTKHS